MRITQIKSFAKCLDVGHLRMVFKKFLRLQQGSKVSFNVLILIKLVLQSAGAKYKIGIRGVQVRFKSLLRANTIFKISCTDYICKLFGLPSL